LANHHTAFCGIAAPGSISSSKLGLQASGKIGWTDTANPSNDIEGLLL
jgi:hypothetical protein